MNLKETLTGAGKVRWLDVGCGGEFNDGFRYLDVRPPEEVSQRHRDRYLQADIARLTESQRAALGCYDLIRLQHVLEHLSFEDGAAALRNCSRLLDPGGYLLISVPDLRRYAERYLSGDLPQSEGAFEGWAGNRIPADAPASAYFSIFAHGIQNDTHRWCYDFAGLDYQLRRCGEFTDIRELTLDDPLADVPFTHNRPVEDVCVLARRNRP